MAHSNESRACVYLCTSKTKMSRQLLHHTHTKIVPSHLIDTSVIQFSVNHGANLVNLYWSWASSTQGWYWHGYMWFSVIRITLVCRGPRPGLIWFWNKSATFAVTRQFSCSHFSSRSLFLCLFLLFYCFLMEEVTDAKFLSLLPLTFW